MIIEINFDEDNLYKKTPIDSEFIELLLEEIEFKTLWDRNKPEKMDIHE